MSYLLLSTISGQKIGALSYTDGDTLPNHFANGLPYESDGTLAVSVDGAISHYHQGLPFTASGRLAGTLSETPTRFGGGAAPFSASGHLTLGSSGVTHYSGGICYTESGSIGSSAGGPPLIQRYFTQLDGQSKFFRRETVWECVDPVVEVVFIGYKPTTTYMLFDGDLTNNARAFAFVNANTGFVNCPNAQTLELNGVAVTPNTGAAEPVEGELNRIRVSFTGSWKVQVLGTRFARDAAFAPTIIESIKLTDPADTTNTFNYPMDKNLAYELADGVEIGAELVTSNASYDWVGTGSYDVIGLGFPATASKTYYIELDLRGGTEAGTQMKINGASGDSVFLNYGELYKFTISGLDGNVSLQCGSTPYRGTTLVTIKELPNSAFIFENGSVDQSDRLLVTEKQDGSGFVGETGIEYDYATGAAPVDSYGTEYSTAYS